MVWFVSTEQIIELVRREEYEVDPYAVAEAILAYIAVPRCVLGSEDVLVARERMFRSREPHA